MKLKLGVNIDHVATLRQVRGTTYPDPVDAARICAAAGAHGLTIHLREDRRHIQDADLAALMKADLLPVNLELSLAPSILAIALRAKPAEVCLVPERRQELTTEGGLEVVRQLGRVRDAVTAFKACGIVPSLFIAADPRQIDAAVEVGAPCIELHTGGYCEARGRPATEELRRLIAGARRAHAQGLQVNAGHGIHLGNLDRLLAVPYLHTLNIGHSIIARAVLVGMKAAVREMLVAMRAYRGGRVSGGTTR